MRTVSFTQKYSLFQFNGAFPYPFSDYDIYLDYIAGVNANKSGFQVYQPGFVSPVTTFQPASGYIVIKKAGLSFSIVLPDVTKPDVLKFKRRYNIFTYPYSVPLDFSRYSDYIESVLITNANGTGFVSYAPGYSAPFTAFQPGSSYLVVAYGDFDMENPEPTPTPTSTPEPTPNQTPTQTPTTTSQATPTPTPTPRATPPATPQTTPQATPSVTPSMTGSPGATPASTSTQTPTPTRTPVQTSTPTQTRTPTNTATAAPTNTPTQTRTPTPTTTTTLTMTPTPSVTMTRTPTMTPSITPTKTPVSTPTNTPTPSVTPTMAPNSICISNAGFTAANGTYTKNTGDYYYTNSNNIMLYYGIWNSPYWVIQQYYPTQLNLYKNSSTTPYVIPQTGWTLDSSGVAPAPNVNAGACPSPTPTTTTTLTMTPTPTAPRLIANITIGTASSNTYNVNLRSVFQGIYGASTAPATAVFTVAGNIGSTSSAVAALDTGVWPTGSTVTLIVPAVSDGTNSPANGMVAGKGGAPGGTNSNGGAGGPAINLNYNLTIQNNGIIGGGGGGSGGCNWPWCGVYQQCPGGGGSGAGGAGITPGAAGTGGSGGNGGAGTYRVGGAKGAQLLGDGGSLGSAGAGAGCFGSKTTNYGGGAAGKAVNLNGWTCGITGTGTTLGTVS